MMVDTLQFFYRYGVNIVTLLHNVHHHLVVKKQDFPFVITGYPGIGKSDMGMHLFELWKRVILKQGVVEEDIQYIKANKLDWLKNFKIMKPADMTINDEAADGLSSKESMKRFGRDIQKLYNVNRKKRLFSVLVIPDFFELPSYFRKRVRGLLYIDKQGHYKFYTMYGIKFLNAYNENKKLKRMDVAYPLFQGMYPKYEGVLRDVYDANADISADQILDEIIIDNTEKPKGDDVKKLLTDRMVEMRKAGASWQSIADKLSTTRVTLTKYYKEYLLTTDEGKIESSK